MGEFRLLFGAVLIGFLISAVTPKGAGIPVAIIVGVILALAEKRLTAKAAK